MKIVPTSIFNLRVLNLRGDEYSATLLDCPTVSGVKDLLAFEIDYLKQQAHQHDDDEMTDDIEFRVSRGWQRVTALQTLLAMVNTLAAEDDVQTAPFRVEVHMAGRYVGAIDVIEIPAYARAPPE